MIRTLIIEDEEPAALRLEKLLKEIDPQIEILDKLESIQSAVKWLEENKHPDLMMLDIQLADGQSFDIFKKVKVDCFVIFTTAYDEYAIKAFELNSIDYLLKPVNKTKLAGSIEKFNNLNRSKSPFDFNELIQAIESKRSVFKKRFAISIGAKIKSIETPAIAYFYSMEKSSFLGTFEGQEYPVDYSLDKLETMLDPEVFFRINRQYLINFGGIVKIHVLSKSRLELEIKGYKERMQVSTAKAHAFRLWIDR
jgi:two-component system, LytTR family, response regulator LytT